MEFCSGSSTSRSAEAGSPRQSELILSISSRRKTGLRGAGLAHGLDDLARQGADVGLAVAADLRLVAHAAQGDAHEVAAEGARHRPAEGGLARARGADEAEDGALDSALELAHGDEVEDPLLDLFQVVVVLVEDQARALDVPVVGGGFLPGKVHDPLEVGAQERRTPATWAACGPGASAPSGTSPPPRREAPWPSPSPPAPWPPWGRPPRRPSSFWISLSCSLRK